MTRPPISPIVFSRRITWLLAGTAVLAFGFTILSIARSPLVDVDEVYIASAALSLAEHGRGIPTVLPAGPWNIPFPEAYGPTFFQPTAMAIRLFGLSAEAVRSVCLVGAIGIVLASGALTWLAGSSRSWTICAAAIMWFTPEIGRAATNGRMDTIAVALEVAAMAALVWRERTSPATPVTNGAIAGGLIGLALMTTPRTILWAAGLAGAVPVAAWHYRAARGVLISLLVCCLTAMICVSLWTVTIGVGPVAYATTLVQGVGHDAFNSMTTSVRAWSLHAGALASLVALFILVAGVVRARLSSANGIAPGLIVLWGWTLTAAALYIVRVNHTFFRDIYFVTPITAIALATAGTIRPSDKGRRALLAACATTALVFVGVRAVKCAQVIETWNARDPVPLETFFRTHLPHEARVFGLSQYYFYAVERAGAHFKAFDAEPYGKPFPGSPTIGRPPESVLPQLRAGVRGHLLIWPAAVPLDPPFECAQPHVVATWIPPHHDEILTRLPFFRMFADNLTYPATTIYEIPADCPPL